LSKPLNWILNQAFEVALQSTSFSSAGDLWSKQYERKINYVLSKVPIEELFIV
jgi:hypothetical protein